MTYYHCQTDSPLRLELLTYDGKKWDHLFCEDFLRKNKIKVFLRESGCPDKPMKKGRVIAQWKQFIWVLWDGSEKPWTCTISDVIRQPQD